VVRTHHAEALQNPLLTDQRSLVDEKIIESANSAEVDEDDELAPGLGLSDNTRTGCFSLATMRL
jgi:hypothetical protein